MRVRIVCYEDPDCWILGKFAKNLVRHLGQMGVDADLSDTPDDNADINHHIIYLDYDGRSHGVDTLMITHIDTAGKLLQLKRQIETADLGICMSSSTVRQLHDAGFPSGKLCYILPGQNELLRPKKSVIGVSTRVYQDGRKREHLLLKAAAVIDPTLFFFKIMGEGWDSIVAQLKKRGFQVDYFPAFDEGDYVELLESLDYYFYPGEDEGAMGVVDALAAGVPVVSTPQGYHLDVPGGLPFLFRSESELLDIFRKISADRARLQGAVADWTWEDYARKHLQLWEHLLGRPQSQGVKYRDGFSSLGRYAGELATVKRKIDVGRKAIQGSLRNGKGRIKSLFRPRGVKF